MDDSDEESSVGESLQREALKKQAMKQTKLEIQRALAEDSTVYEYDNIYDDIQQKKAESHASSLVGKGEKKPKYIQNILKAAELRKKEQEKRMEKKIQKERETEGDAFDDKEAFVTSAYKKKLQERAEEEEREKREAALEACLDVTKQKDLSGFYRHLLNQAVGEEEVPKCSLRETRIKEEKLSGDSCDSRHMNKSSDESSRPHIPLKREDNPDADSDLETDSSDDENSTKVRAGDKKETGQSHTDCSGKDTKHHKSQRRSSSEERSHHSKVSGSHPEREEAAEIRKEKSGQYREKDRERKHKGHEKEEHPRSEDSYRKQEELDDRQRRKDRKERDDYERELRRERDRDDKFSEWEGQRKERLLNSKDRYRESDEGAKNKRAREDKDEKKEGERKNRSPESFVKDDHQTKESEMGEEQLCNSEQLPELKHKTGGDGTEQAEKALESQSKFAKRSSEETVLSARDRYLARQMARVSTKSYIEKEED
ncbi:nuclear speckle splicing regulatory protein 1 isoform X2 [Tiliqua scincoides]